MVLAYTTADGGTARLALEGITRIGRAADNQIQVLDPSASSYHCEVRVEDGMITVHDLESSNGITVNGAPVKSGPLSDGDILRIGATEFVVQDEALLPSEIPVPVRVPNLSSNASNVGPACRNHANVPAEWRCSKCGANYCPQCVTDGRKFGVAGVKFCPVCLSKAENLKVAAAAKKRVEKSFASELIAAWKYPFHGEGVVILLAGSIFLTLTGIAERFAAILGLLIFVTTTGYMAAYSQKIITATANGEDEPPTWPDFSDFWQDIVLPFFQAIGLFLFYLSPYWISLVFLVEGGPVQKVISAALLLLALFLMPMAWLAVSMHDSMLGLSPHFTIPSILRIPGPYLAVVLELVLLVGIDTALARLLEHGGVPVLAWVLSPFIGLYFLMVISRILGVLYYRNRARLGWF